MGIHRDDLPDYKDYIDSYVAFIDILGFDQKVKSIKNPSDFFEIDKLMYTMKSVTDNYTAAVNIFKNFKFIAISDTIIVTIP